MVTRLAGWISCFHSPLTNSLPNLPGVSIYPIKLSLVSPYGSLPTSTIHGFIPIGFPKVKLYCNDKAPYISHVLKEIHLSNGLITLVDDEDFESVSKYVWRPSPSSNRIYAKARFNGKYHFLHRMVMGFPNSRIDHKDSNPLNNQKSNLRPCNQSQNTANSLPKPHSSKFKGVFYFPGRRKCWSSKIMVNYKSICLGYHLDEVDAAKAYDAAALKHFGEFARTNKQMGLYE